jgi:cytochrome c551/c552
MDVLIPPTIKFIQILPYLVYAMLLFHLPYMGMLLVSSIMSVAYKKPKPQLSKDLISLVLGKTGPWLVFGLMPVASLAILYKLILFKADIPIDRYLLDLLGLHIAGVVLLAFYRRFNHILLGAAGALITMLYSFHLVNVLSFMMFPEKWPFHTTILPYPLFYITPIWQFGIFLMLSLIITGAGILFIYYKWSERKLAEDSPHYDFLKYNAFGLLLAGSLLLPPLILLDLATLPSYSLSIGVFVLNGLLMISLFFLLLSVAGMIRNRKEPQPPHIVIAFLLAIISFGLVIGKDRTLQTNASLETIEVQRMSAEKVWLEEEGKREEIYAKIGGIDPKKGEEIFNAVCTACHAFDEKKLGPPMNDVLKKYQGKEAELIEFLKNPKKIDPAYPSMPNPGLTSIKIKSVVKYLMGGSEEKKEEDSKE